MTRYSPHSWFASAALVAADVALCAMLLVVAFMTAPLWILGMLVAWGWEVIHGSV